MKPRTAEEEAAIKERLTWTDRSQVTITPPPKKEDEKK